MITSVFGKSKPLNYILLVSVTIVAFLLYTVTSVQEFTLSVFLDSLAVLLFLLFGGFLTNFIAKKNKLVRDNSYVLLFYFGAFFYFPNLFNNLNLIVSSIFISLAMRRLFSMQSLLTPKEKIFDAALWICIASLFHFWSILFLILVFTSILFYVASDLRHWVLPIIAVITVGVLFVMASLWFKIEWLSHFLYDIQTNFDFQYFTNPVQKLVLLVYGVYAGIFFVLLAMNVTRKPLVQQASYKNLLLLYIVSLGVFALSAHKSNDILIYSFLPFALIATTGIEQIKDTLAREVFVWIYVLMGIGVYYFQL